MENQDIDDHIAIEVGVHATSIRKMISGCPPLSPECCIFKAPKKYREVKQKKRYHPLHVSIGPFHHGTEDLNSMEKRKPAYLDAFLSRCGYNIRLETCSDMIKESEQRIRNCYAETIEFDSNDFVKMILFDSCFILEMILRFNKVSYRDQEVTDHLLSHPRIVEDVKNDLILIENQLPFFVLQDLFDLTLLNSIGPRDSLTNLCIEYLAAHLLSGDSELAKQNVADRKQRHSKHLLDLLRMCQIPSIIPRKNPTESSAEHPIGTATELEEASMVIKPGPNDRTVTDIRYSRGVLEIPKLMVNDSSERVLFNLIVLELFLYNQESYISDYIHFMDNLIDESKDVDLLIRNGVIGGFSRGNKQLANLINNLRPPLLTENYLYHGIQKQVGAYCKVPHHKWRETLRRDYCSSPWMIASTIAAIILLILTFIQTVCAIITIATDQKKKVSVNIFSVLACSTFYVFLQL